MRDFRLIFIDFPQKNAQLHCNSLQLLCNSVQLFTTPLQLFATPCNSSVTPCNSSATPCNSMQLQCNSVQLILQLLVEFSVGWGLQISLESFLRHLTKLYSKVVAVVKKVIKILLVHKIQNIIKIKFQSKNI